MKQVVDVDWKRLLPCTYESVVEVASKEEGLWQTGEPAYLN